MVEFTFINVAGRQSTSASDLCKMQMTVDLVKMIMIVASEHKP